VFRARDKVGLVKAVSDFQESVQGQTVERLPGRDLNQGLSQYRAHLLPPGENDVT
jgi:hypothetical protein